jgi:uncharacterized membrane-anchored protein YjiN (DUF445 family)
MMPTPPHNQHIATIFRSMAERLAAQRANPYRVRAYRKAADTIEALEEDIADIAARHALEDIEGVGKDLADKIEEFLRTGTIQAYEALRTPLPDALRSIGSGLSSDLFWASEYVPSHALQTSRRVRRCALSCDRPRQPASTDLS